MAAGNGLNLRAGFFVDQSNGASRGNQAPTASVTWAMLRAPRALTVKASLCTVFYSSNQAAFSGRADHSMQRRNDSSKGLGAFHPNDFIFSSERLYLRSCPGRST